MPKPLVRVIWPDSHGSQADPQAMKAFLADLKFHDPDQIVMLGDHGDCGGFLSKHPKKSKEEKIYSFDNDMKCLNSQLDEAQKSAPRAKIYYIMGNHEDHIERFALEHIESKQDVEKFLSDNGIEKQIDAKGRGIKVIKYHEKYDGLPIPNMIRLGNCYFTHFIKGCGGEHAAAKHVKKAAGNICFGHIHRMQSYFIKNLKSEMLGAWSFGCLSLKQPIWIHNEITDWVHGYGVQEVAQSGLFMTHQVPIINGKSVWNRV